MAEEKWVVFVQKLDFDVPRYGVDQLGAQYGVEISVAHFFNRLVRVLF